MSEYSGRQVRSTVKVRRDQEGACFVIDPNEAERAVRCCESLLNTEWWSD